jgi:alkyl hydroperoxide reductase subunit AhpC
VVVALAVVVVALAVGVVAPAVGVVAPAVGVVALGLALGCPPASTGEAAPPSGVVAADISSSANSASECAASVKSRRGRAAYPGRPRRRRALRAARRRARHLDGGRIPGPMPPILDQDLVESAVRRTTRHAAARASGPADRRAPSRSQPTQGESMSLQIGSTAPDFEADTSQGPIHFYEWLGDSWAVLFSHPRNFTPVCTTELGYMASIEPEFERRGVKIIGLSVDPVSNHAQWAKDIEETQGTAPNYPIIGDADFAVSKLYGMLPLDVSGEATDRTAADNQTVRNVFVIGPDRKIKLILIYPMTTGRNFDEVLRVIDSLQLTAKHKVATPVNWQPGDDVIIAGSVSDEEAHERYPDGWQSPRPYIRIVPQPH